MFRKQKHLIGLDLGSHAIKMIQVQEGKTALKLLSLGLTPLPAEAFDEERIKEPEIVASAIQRLAQHLKINQKLAAISISGYEVMIKKIELPTMTKEELKSRMHEELGQYIPYNLEEVNVSYHVLDTAQDRSNRMEVLLVAAKKESIGEYIKLIVQAGFEPVVIDVDFFALSNAYEATYGTADTESVALLDIGGAKTNMNIFHKGIPIFTRDISIGGSQISDKIRSRFGLSPEEAERVKLGEMRGLSKNDVKEVFTGVVSNWVGEVKRAINFYYNNYADGKIGKLLLSGGSCRIPGLDKLFQKDMGITTEIFNPLSRLEFDPDRLDPAYIEYIGPQMAIALGLGLRRVDEK